MEYDSSGHYPPECCNQTSEMAIVEAAPTTHSSNPSTMDPNTTDPPSPSDRREAGTKETAEAERLAKEQAEAKALQEAKEKADAEAAKAAAEAEQRAKETAEAERLAKEQAEAKALQEAKEKADAEAAKAAAEAEQKVKEAAEAERLAKEQAEAKAKADIESKLAAQAKKDSAEDRSLKVGTFKITDQNSDKGTWDAGSTADPKLYVRLNNRTWNSKQFNNQTTCTVDESIGRVKVGDQVRFELIDVDVMRDDPIGSIKYTVTEADFARGETDLSFESVEGLKLQFVK